MLWQADQTNYVNPLLSLSYNEKLYKMAVILNLLRNHYWKSLLSLEACNTVKPFILSYIELTLYETKRLQALNFLLFSPTNFATFWFILPSLEKKVLIFVVIQRLSTKENFVKVTNNSTLVIYLMFTCEQNKGLCLYQILEVNTNCKHNTLIQLVL